jgi:DNA-binding NtrC family response regulator
VYGISRQAGGIAQLESRLNEGTTVRMLLRVTDDRADTYAVPVGQRHDLAMPSATVLIVDDDPGVRRFLKDALDSLGYRVIEASDGSAALKSLDHTLPDVMVVDFAMSGLNGAEVAKAARARRPGLPVILASGYADTAAIAELTGDDTVILRKPFRMDVLQQSVATALRKNAYAEQSQA